MRLLKALVALMLLLIFISSINIVAGATTKVDLGEYEISFDSPDEMEVFSKSEVSVILNSVLDDDRLIGLNVQESSGEKATIFDLSYLLETTFEGIAERDMKADEDPVSIAEVGVDKIQGMSSGCTNKNGVGFIIIAWPAPDYKSVLGISIPLSFTEDEISDIVSSIEVK